VATNFVGEINGQSTELKCRRREVQLPHPAGGRQTNYLIPWTQANQLADQLTGGEDDSRVGYSQALPCI